MKKRMNGEGSYRKANIKGKEYYIYDFPRDDSGKRKRLYAKTSAELQLKIDKEKNQERFKLNASDFTVSKLVRYWLVNICEVSPKTKDHYFGILKTRIENWKKFDIGNVPCKDITSSMIEHYLFSLCEDYAARSIERTWAVLEQALKYGIKTKHCPFIELNSIKKPKEIDVIKKQKQQIILEKHDMDRLYQECLKKNDDNSYHYGISAIIIALIINTGLRVNEACSLQWKDIARDCSYLDINSVFVTVNQRDSQGNATGEKITVEKAPKTNTSKRRVPIPNNARILLEKTRSESPSADLDSLVFHTRTNKPVTRSSVEKCCKNIVKNCNLPVGITPHTLRHAYGSLLISEGTDIKVVSKLLGHKSVSFTYDIYINVLRADEKKATEVFDNLFSKD